MSTFRPAKKIALSLMALGAATLQMGCGSSSSVSNMVSNVQVNAYEQNGDVWAALSASLNTNGFILAGLNVPIVDPSNPSIEYGQIALTPVVCSSGTTCLEGGQLSLSLNLTAVAELPSSSNLLPNNTAIPLGGLSSVIGLAIGSTGGRIYVDLSKPTAVLGVAFPFAALNGAGSYVPGLDIFDSIPFNDVTAYVGVFAGSAEGQTGIALFVDASSVIFPAAGALPVQTVSSNALEAVASRSSHISLKANKNSSYDEYVLLSKMESLGAKHAVLELK